MVVRMLIDMVDSWAYFPRRQFDELVEQWTRSCSGNRGRAAAAAGLRDVTALIAAAPLNVSSLLPATCAQASMLTSMVTSTITYLRDVLLSTFRSKASKEVKKRSADGIRQYKYRFRS